MTTVKVVQADTGSGKSAWAAASPFFSDSPSPRLSRLPHSKWREHQLETARWLVDRSGSTIVLTRTKSLQTQYGQQYGASVLFGRANYDCMHPDANGASCADCLFQTEMGKCPHACWYLLKKAEARSSPFIALNYSYFLSAAWPRQDKRRYVYLDEAHNLDAITLDWAGCRITDKDRSDWRLPSFPCIEHRCRNVLLDLPPPTDLALGWLIDAREVMAKHFVRLRRSAKTEAERERLRDCENLGRKLTATREAIETCPDEWYVRSGYAGLFKRGYPVPGFLARPLTAKHHFSRYFLNGAQVVAMSATIGDPVQFSRELGITDYDFRAVPSRFAPERRPVHVLDVPNMSYVPDESDNAREARFSHQADAIADFIKRYPPDWCGLIHVTRKKEERLLHDRLASRGLADRVWYMRGKEENYIPTDKQLKAWERRKRRVPNSLLATCSFWEGYDGKDEKLCVIGKTPFPRYGTEHSYERAWSRYSDKRYRQAAAIGLMQGAGRTRRGEEDDYDTSDEIRGAVAIADGSIGKVERYFSESFREALCLP